VNVNDGSYRHATNGGPLILKFNHVVPSVTRILVYLPNWCLVEVPEIHWACNSASGHMECSCGIEFLKTETNV
jgi:hypothetical protein